MKEFGIVKAEAHLGILEIGMDNGVTLSIPFENLKPLKNASEDDVSQIEIFEGGQTLHFPLLDVHLGPEYLFLCAYPPFRELYEARKQEEDRHFGNAIRDLRIEAGIETIEGIPSDMMEEIEKSGKVKTPKLSKYAKAHEISLNDYLNLISEKMTVRE